MKKRWTYELVIDTQFMNDEGTEELEELGNDAASKKIEEWLDSLFENEPVETILRKFEARDQENTG